MICFVRQLLKYSELIWQFAAREGKKVKYVFANTTADGKKVKSFIIVIDRKWLGSVFVPVFVYIKWNNVTCEPSIGNYIRFKNKIK
jgi:hypothetical protein